MNNYEYCAIFVGEHLAAGGRVLDYGCGKGEIVSLLRDRGYDAVGCDTFYEGGVYGSDVVDPLFERGFIRRMDGDRIPFEDASFDVVVNNQVMEHVVDLDAVLTEIARVVKPGGVVFSMFPDRSVWREGHCGVPFLHWFPKRNRIRVYYAWVFRVLGFGYHHGGKSAITWSRDFCTWLDDWTYYRSYKEIHEAFEKGLGTPHHIEADWLERRLGSKVRFAPSAVRAFTTRRLAGLVFWCSAPT